MGIQHNYKHVMCFHCKFFLHNSRKGAKILTTKNAMWEHKIKSSKSKSITLGWWIWHCMLLFFSCNCIEINIATTTTSDKEQKFWQPCMPCKNIKSQVQNQSHPIRAMVLTLHVMTLLTIVLKSTLQQLRHWIKVNIRMVDSTHC